MALFHVSLGSHYSVPESAVFFLRHSSQNSAIYFVVLNLCGGGSTFLWPCRVSFDEGIVLALQEQSSVGGWQHGMKYDFTGEVYNDPNLEFTGH